MERERERESVSSPRFWWEAILDAAETTRRFRGPIYYDALSLIHSVVHPKLYLEIGVAAGASLRRVSQPTRCIGIDPNPMWKPPLKSGVHVDLYPITSDEYFEKHARLPMSIDLAFIDGMHTFDQALRDLINLQPYLHSGSVVLMHDCMPLNARTAARNRTTLYWSGDVWKVIPLIHELRPALAVGVIQASPTGLGIITGFGSGQHARQSDADAACERFAKIPFSFWEDYRTKAVKLIDNNEISIRSHLVAALSPVTH